MDALAPIRAGDDAEGVGSMVDTIAPGVHAQPELYAIVAAGVLLYKHRDRIVSTFSRLFRGGARV